MSQGDVGGGGRGGSMSHSARGGGSSRGSMSHGAGGGGRSGSTSAGNSTVPPEDVEGEDEIEEEDENGVEVQAALR